FYLGSVAELQEDFEKALPFYVRVQTGTYATAAQVRVAHILAELGRLDAALAHLERRRDAFPDEDVALSEAEASILSDSGRIRDALKAYDEAIKRHPDSRSLRFSRSFLLERENRVSEALAELTMLLEEQPDDPVALNALGYTLADRTDEYQRAFEYISRALEQIPNDAAIIDSMGWVHYRLGNNEEALKYLRQAYDLTQDPEVAAHLGEVLWVQGEVEEAQSIWEQALLDHPDHEKLRDTIQRFLP
ncbi:MAG: tetratricopeptide repeat protein, partial [Pseudomonadota bacterium]